MFAQDIKNFHKNPALPPKPTFCGLPHHMYLPRSTEDGTKFSLVTVVSDIENGINEGNDDVEHLYDLE